MNLEFNREITISGKEYFVKAQVYLSFDESTHQEEYWGAMIQVTDTEISGVEVEQLTVLDYSEEDQEYNIRVLDPAILEEAQKTVVEWSFDEI